MSSYCKYYREKEQVSYDNGVHWEDVPGATRKGSLLQRDSQDCGYEPPTNYKLINYYEYESPYYVPCDSYSTLTSSDTYTTERDDTHLISAVIGDCVNTIGVGAFFNVPSLRSVTIPNTVTTIESSAFSGCTSLSSVTIPDSVTSIGAYAFENCSAMTTVTIGSGITNIGMNAFVNGASLQSITIYATTPPSFNVTSFNDTNNCPIYVPCESVNAYKTDIMWDMHANRIYGIPPCVDYSTQYLTFVPLENGEFTVGLVDTSSSYDIYYSTNSGSSWNELTLTSNATTSIPATSGQKIMWLGYGYINYLRFNSTCNYNVEGNVLSLDYGVNFTGQTSCPNSQYGGMKQHLFENSTKLISAEHLVLPHQFSTYTGAGGTCGYMFRGCTSLTTAPELPATTLIRSCYSGMFEGCTSLRTAPLIPATTAAEYCYYYMFSGCTSLTTPPQLPAYTLAERCYQGMFQGCTSLTTAPTLPATIMANHCYNSMFANCTSLVTAPNLPSTSLANYCYNGMFGWCSSLRNAPTLSASTLSEACYRNMFYKCTSLTTAPELPARTLVNKCYQWMFSDCTSLNYIKCLATDISATDCTQYWATNVASSGTFVKNSSMSSWATGYDGIPYNWSVQNA